MNIVGSEVYAKTAEEVVYVNMVGSEVYAKTAEEMVYVNMVGSKVYAKNVHNVSIRKEQWTVLIVL